MIYQILNMVRKEFIQIRRDRRFFPLLFVAPILQLFFFGYAATMDIKNIPLIVWDQDHSAESHSLVQEVTSSRYFDLKGHVQGYDQIEQAMHKSQAIIALVIPPDFSKNLKTGQHSRLQAVLDGADSNQATIAMSYLSVVVQQYASSFLLKNIEFASQQLIVNIARPAAPLASPQRPQQQTKKQQAAPVFDLPSSSSGQKQNQRSSTSSSRASLSASMSASVSDAAAQQPSMQINARTTRPKPAQSAPGSSSAGPSISMGSIGEMIKNRSLLVRAEPRLWYNPELRSANFMVPGVVVMILLIMTMMLTAVAVVREKEVGTIEQVMVTPIRPAEFILGKLVPFIIIGFLEVTIVMLMAVLWFKVPIKGSVLGIYGYSALFLLTTLGMGLLISTVSHNQQQAMITTFFTMFPMMLLSGFMFPISSMPRVIQYLTYIIPLRYFLVVIRSLFMKGVGFGVLWPQAAGLLCIGLIVMTLSVRRFRKTIG